MINRVVLTGRLTKDTELRYTPQGTAVCTLTLAVNRQYANAQGQKEADFFSCVAWRQLGELCSTYLKKGSQVALEGRLQSRSYDNKEGKRVYVVEVVADNIQFLSTSGERREDSSENQGRFSSYDMDDPFAADSRTIDIDSDDLPF